MKKKYVGAIIVVVVIIVALIITFKPSNTITRLKRPSSNEQETIYIVNVDTDGVNQNIEVKVAPIELNSDEIEELFQNAYNKLLEIMKADNSSLQEVRENLNFCSKITEYGIKVDYTLSDYSVINCFGEVSNENVSTEGQEYVINAEFTYKKAKKIYNIPIKVFPPVYSEKEKVLQSVKNVVEEYNAQDEASDYVKLPDKINDKKVTFATPKESRFTIILFIGLIIGLLYYYKKVTLVKKKEKMRESQLKLDYSDIVTKLTLLLGAGMSSARAFGKISDDYKKLYRNRKNEIHYAYEEIEITSNRIKNGMSEVEAYEKFGRACKIHSYIKLGNMLSQNIRKGADGFITILQAEVSDAFNERKSLAKQAGEEAGTKLLFPMILMLLIVLVIIIVPAFMSF